jgi:hypothetical protein
MEKKGTRVSPWRPRPALARAAFIATLDNLSTPAARSGRHGMNNGVAIRAASAERLTYRECRYSNVVLRLLPKSSVINPVTYLSCRLFEGEFGEKLRIGRRV